MNVAAISLRAISSLVRCGQYSRRNPVRHERPSLGIKFVNAKKSWNRDFVRFCEPKNLLAARHITSPFPSRESSSRNTSQFSRILLSQFRFFSQVVQPRSVGTAPCFRSSPHAGSRLICESVGMLILSKSRQWRDLSACNSSGNRSKDVMWEVEIVSLIEGMRIPATQDILPEVHSIDVFSRRYSRRINLKRDDCLGRPMSQPGFIFLQKTND